MEEYLLKVIDYLNKKNEPMFKCPRCNQDCYEARLRKKEIKEIIISIPCGCEMMIGEMI